MNIFCASNIGGRKRKNGDNFCATVLIKEVLVLNLIEAVAQCYF